MFRQILRARFALTLAPLAAAGLILPATARAQVAAPRHTARRVNSNRQARIAHNIQETYSYKWDLYGGIGFTRFRSGQDLQNNSTVVWDVAATRNLSQKWGIVGDVRGAFGQAKVGNNVYNVYQPWINEYTFQGGVQYRFYAKEKWSVSTQGLAGVGRGNFDGGSKTIPAVDLRMWDDATRPVFTANVNVDYNVYPNLAFRVQPYYIFHTYQGHRTDLDGNILDGTVGGFQHNKGINIGVIYRFGK